MHSTNNALNILKSIILMINDPLGVSPFEFVPDVLQDVAPVN